MSGAPSVLVTGASGYVGRLCLAALAQRKSELSRLVALDWAPPAHRLPDVIYEQRDICDPDLADLLRQHRIDTIVHLASIVRKPAGAPKDIAYRVDVLGTRNVLESATAAGATRLVVTSSGAAYGYHRDNPALLDEEAPLRGNDEFEYARNKRLIEDTLAQWRRDRPALQQIVFRPGTIIGESVHSPVTDVFERSFILGIAGADSPFVFIWDEDLVACIVAAVFGGKPGIYNQAGDGALTTREIARLLRKPYVALPAPLLGAALSVLKAMGLSDNGAEGVNFLRYRPVLSNERLKRDFGYTPRLTSRQAFELYARARGLLPAGRS